MGLKSKLSYWAIERKRKMSKRDVSVVNLKKVKTAGILWNCEDRKAYKNLVETLQERSIQTTGFCFSEQMISIKGESVFSKSDFTRFGLPKSEAVNEFVQTRFDLLIDISLSEEIEAQAVRALSMAHFKAGWSPVEPNYFDMQIDVEQRKEPSFLADQIIHYLSEINKD